jgi:uncharacterized membrane protein (UPF0127 family)
MEAWKKLSIAVLTASVVIAGVVTMTGKAGDGTSEAYNLSGRSSAEAVFSREGEELASLSLEVADSERERRTGLMNRTSLENGTGMIFVWNSSAERSFWMKNTYIPLDMIFIDSDGKVLNVEEAEPQPKASESELEIYRSEGEAMYVVETVQGFSARNNISRGSEVIFRSH